MFLTLIAQPFTTVKSVLLAAEIFSKAVNSVKLLLDRLLDKQYGIIADLVPFPVGHTVSSL
jgi:hypothetical protein